MAHQSYSSELYRLHLAPPKMAASGVVFLFAANKSWPPWRSGVTLVSQLPSVKTCSPLRCFRTEISKVLSEEGFTETQYAKDDLHFANATTGGKAKHQHLTQRKPRAADSFPALSAKEDERSSEDEEYLECPLQTTVAWTHLRKKCQVFNLVKTSTTRSFRTARLTQVRGSSLCRPSARHAG